MNNTLAGKPVPHQLRACEARYWLRKGYTTQERVDELREFLHKKRGTNAIELLIEEMRNQWRIRSLWINQPIGEAESVQGQTK